MASPSSRPALQAEAAMPAHATAPGGSSASYTVPATTAGQAPIGYRELGRGPGLVIVHGSMESADSHAELAEALADVCTVYLVDRRGRGMSGPYADHSISSEVDDLAAVLDATGAESVFAVSSGALVALEAALRLPRVRKLALYEPILVDDRRPWEPAIARMDREFAAGRTAAGLVTAMKVTKFGPAIFGLVPRPVLERLTAAMLTQQDRKAKPGEVTMRQLAPTLQHDGHIILEMAGRAGRYAALQTDVLLLNGTKSPAYLRRAVDDLAAVIPHARRVEFAGLNHGGSGPSQWGGRPAVVARELRAFLGER